MLARLVISATWAYLHWDRTWKVIKPCVIVFYSWTTTEEHLHLEVLFFTTPKHRHHYFAACFEQKQENETKKGNKGCQEIIGLIPFGKKMQDNCHASKCCGVMSPHRKKHQTHFLFIFFFFFFTARRMARILVTRVPSYF